MKYQGSSMRKKTGGRVRPHRKKRRSDLGRDPTETQIGEPAVRAVDSRGNSRKVRVLATNVANVADDEGNTEQATINGVVDNPSNPNYARRNIVTKGAVIDTDAGEARVTSRPGQDGQINAVLVE